MNSKIICLVGDKFHPADEMRPGIENALRAYDLEITEDPGILDGDGLKPYSLMVLTKSGIAEQDNPDCQPWLTEERDIALLEFVREGGGLILLHAGLSRQESARHRVLAGGHFLHHPPACEMTVTSVNNHPISADVLPFTLNEEQYFCAVTIQNTKPILVSNTEQNGAIIAGWTHTFGNGRICALTLGHCAETLKNPNMVRLIRNAATWCLRPAAL